MDARLDPAKYAGLSEGDAHVIRNAGGVQQMRIARLYLAQIAWNAGVVSFINQCDGVCDEI